ncbi:J domain-containing protein CG6693 [Aedes aegypti]|uniref:J domain-containing protein n=1 Tax=Aedes aegypti TaxID=7159 RepID=A0A1S4EV88_AEDAE|nr:J domain-containing protein CG6693 [Aedes aegypti]
MPSTLESCELFYGTRDVYKIFDLPNNAQEKEIKKAYYKLSLKVHPDRVKENEKEDATEKFKVLSKIYSILSDKDKRALYDEQGVIDDDDDSNGTKWMTMWQQFFKPISTEDISNFEKVYIGSELERNDIKKAYLAGKGCINYMFNSVPFMSCEDEPRIYDIVKEMIATEEVPEYKTFTEEPKAKRNRRHKKYAKEAEEAAALKQKREKQQESSLERQIAQRQNERQLGFSAMLDRLAEKYGEEDEDENDTFDLDKYMASKSKNKSKRSQENNTKGKKLKVIKGRVSKKSV